MSVTCNGIQAAENFLMVSLNVHLASRLGSTPSSITHSIVCQTNTQQYSEYTNVNVVILYELLVIDVYMI